MPVYEHEGVVVRFPDAAVGLSVSGLLANKGTFHVKLTPGTDGELFAVLSPAYAIQLTVANNMVTFRRNAFVVQKVAGNVQRHYQVLVSWKPDQIQLAVMPDDNVGGDDACVSLNTEPLYVPVQLLDWARRFNLSHRSTYASPAEFFGVLLESIRQANTAIRAVDGVSLFWDHQRGRDVSDLWIPKREPDSMAGVAGFLQDQSVLAGYQLIQESKAGPGSLDLRAVAPLSTGGLITVCIEGKNAHSDDLEHGITDQLPAYMTSTNARFGIYLVLWYRCGAFDRPTVSEVDLTWSLTKVRPWDTIAVERFDLSFPVSPSHRTYRHT